jgi:hypothetical protein
MGDETIKIGELLIRAGILTEGKLNQRLDLARQLGLPVGQIFMQSGDMTKEQLLNCIHVQSLVLENLVPLSTAVDVIRDIHKKNFSLDQALSNNGLGDQHLTHRLGELLVQSSYLTEENLAWALLTSGEIGVPLGHVLIQTGVVPPDIVGLALTTQRQIRMRIMTIEEAVDRLKTYQPTVTTTSTTPA